MNYNKEINELTVAIAKLNSKFPQSVIGNGIEKEVFLNIEIIDDEVRRLIYEIRGKWDAKYRIEQAIEGVIANKAVELHISIIKIPE